MIKKINPYDEFSHGTWSDAFIRFLEAIEEDEKLLENDPDYENIFELSAPEDV